MTAQDYLKLETPIDVGGQEIVIVEDQFSTDEKPYEYTDIKTEDGRYTLYVHEDKLVKLQQKHPLAKVYGLFQLLYDNERISSGHAVNVFYRNRTNGSGIFFQGEDDFTSEGKFTFTTKGSFIRDRILNTVNADKSLWHEVDSSESGLVLPVNHLLTGEEKAIIQKQKTQKQVIQTTIACAIVVLMTLGANLFLKFKHEAKLKEIEALRSELASLKDDINVLQKTRIGTYPDIAQNLEFVGRAYILSENLSTVTTVDNSKYIPPTFQGETFIITDDENTKYIDMAYKGMNVSTSYLPGGRLKVILGQRMGL